MQLLTNHIEMLKLKVGLLGPLEAQRFVVCTFRNDEIKETWMYCIGERMKNGEDSSHKLFVVDSNLPKQIIQSRWTFLRATVMHSGEGN